MLVGLKSLPRLLLILLVAGVMGPVPGQEPKDPFAEESLKLRTALHYDSALGAPLEALVRLYQKENRENELVGLYQAHIAQYPDDAGAKAVLAQVMTALERPGAGEFIQSAVQQHPEHAHLQYLLSRDLRKRDDVRSLEALSRAIDLEKGKIRRSLWLGELLERSRTEKGRELAVMQLKKLLLAEGQTAETMFSLGRVMHRHDFFELSIVALQKALALNLNPEDRIEASILAAQAEAALGKNAEAGVRLERILAKLAPGHHRRQEVMSLRVSVVATDEERESLLLRSRQLYEKNPAKATAILDYAEVLAASGRVGEAIDVLVKGAGQLPESAELESRAIGLLEKQSVVRELISFLESRLELAPERAGLRFRLVKAHLENGDPLAAEQDLKLVLASLEEEEQSAKLLELARFLRSSEKRKPSLDFFRRFLEREPERLDVAREACEILLEDGLEDQVRNLLSTLGTGGVEPENMLDLGNYLVDEQFFGPAERLLAGFVEQSGILPFEPGLLLARASAELGKRDEAAGLLEDLRKDTDSPSRYRMWLESAMLIQDRFGTAEAFFEKEQAQFRFTGDEWTVEQVEKFLHLCEMAERRQLAGRVSQAIRQRLSSESLDGAVRIRLRQLLVRTLQKDPGSAPEVEEQLKQLAVEDPARGNEYQLRLALLYHNVQRPDLAGGVLAQLDLRGVDSPDLLRDSYRMLMEFGDRELAGAALETVTALEPSDLFSWERWLSLLAAEGREEEFRAAIRRLLQGIAQRGKAAEWREDSRRSLRWHLLDSYWRSVARILSREERIEEALPLLEGVERVAQGEDLLWLNWGRAVIHRRLGRDREFRSAVEQLIARLEMDEGTVLAFPDGLSIPLRDALESLENAQAPAPSLPGVEGLPLLGQPELRWGFEVDEGARAVRVRPVAGGILVLDNWGQVYRVDGRTGKLVWKKSYPVPGIPVKSFLETIPGEPWASARKMRDMLVAGDGFLLGFEGEIRAYRVDDGSLKWVAELPGEPSGGDSPLSRGAVPGILMDAAGDVVVAFDPGRGLLSGWHSGSGKLLWQTRMASRAVEETGRDDRPVSMNCGLSIKNGRVLAFGRECGIFQAATGRRLWGFQSRDVRVFPVLLREQREDLSEEELVTLEQTRPAPVWIPSRPGARRRHLDYFGGRELSDDDVMSFLAYPGSLLAPAVNWARRRLDTGETAHGVITDEYLWLMDGSGLQRISLDFPLFARHFDVAGTFLGAAGSSGWVLDGEDLSFVDGQTGTVRVHSLREVGASPSGIVRGGRVFVRGDRGIAVFNAWTGRRVSNGRWDRAALDYLGSPAEPGEEEKDGIIYSWPGLIGSSGPGHPVYCYPMGDALSEGMLYGVFGGTRIAAFGESTKK